MSLTQRDLIHTIIYQLLKYSCPVITSLPVMITNKTWVQTKWTRLTLALTKIMVYANYVVRDYSHFVRRVNCSGIISRQEKLCVFSFSSYFLAIFFPIAFISPLSFTDNYSTISIVISTFVKYVAMHQVKFLFRLHAISVTKLTIDAHLLYVARRTTTTSSRQLLDSSAIWQLFNCSEKLVLITSHVQRCPSCCLLNRFWYGSKFLWMNYTFYDAQLINTRIPSDRNQTRSVKIYVTISPCWITGGKLNLMISNVFKTRQFLLFEPYWTYWGLPERKTLSFRSFRSLQFTVWLGGTMLQPMDLPVASFQFVYWDWQIRVVNNSESISNILVIIVWCSHANP